MNFEQPKPDSKNYSDLISEIQKGIIKIPIITSFQVDMHQSAIPYFTVRRP
jgi:hypothetical protein